MSEQLTKDALSSVLRSGRRFTDLQLLKMAVQCLEHAMQSTAIRDCQCAQCRGFTQETGELLETIKSELAP